MVKKFVLSISLVLIIISTSFAETIQLPRTGQTKCYDTGGAEIPCAGTGQDGEIQAVVAWPDPRFTITYCDTSGPCADQSSDCDSNASTDVVIDDLTGLMWARDGNLATIAMNWSQALEYSNNLNLCGYSDWRLPNINELESIRNEGENMSTWLNEHRFINVDYYPSIYWTSTTWERITNYAYYVPITYPGWLGYAELKSNYAYVWPVRGETKPPAKLWKTGQTICYDTTGAIIDCSGTGQDGDIQVGVEWPQPRFKVTGDCVTDNLTGLVWVKDPDSITRTWQQALDYANSLSLCAYSDWRLPNYKELRSLIDFGRYSPALPADHPFTNVRYEYWSSTTWGSTNWPDHTSLAWELGIENGSIVGYDKAVLMNVWPVRGGQAGSPICEHLVADAGPDRIVKSGEFVHFNASNSSCLEQIVSFNWIFGDGDTAEGTAVSHRFSKPKVYEVTLTIKDSLGRIATDTVLITVEPLKTTVSFSERDIIGLTHSASVTASYYWAGDFANTSEYYVTNIGYDSKNVIYSDIVILSSEDDIIFKKYRPAGLCFWSLIPLFYKMSVRGSKTWNTGFSVMGNSILLLRTFWIPSAFGVHGPPILRPQWNCAFTDFDPWN